MPATQDRKEAIRRAVWDHMEREDLAAFPRPVHGRIPNFVGAEEAAHRAGALELWEDAHVIKANPDSPQRPLRRLALEHRKILYMAVPRLKKRECFIELRPHKILHPEKAATIRGAFRYGEPRHPSEMKAVDLVLAGSVAVNRHGARVGKGGGYSDLEYALGRELGLLTDETPVITTVHPCQVLDRDLPMTAHDGPLDVIVTPDETIPCAGGLPKPAGILWDDLPDEKVAGIPALRDLRPDPSTVRVKD